MDLNRRSFLAATLAAAIPTRGAARPLTLARVSAISDEVARSPAEAIEFAHQFGLQWLSLRDIPFALGAKKTSYHSLDPDALKQAAKEFHDAGIKIAFLDTPFLKFGLPGTEQDRKMPDDPAAREKRIALTLEPHIIRRLLAQESPPLEPPPEGLDFHLPLGMTKA